MFPITVVQYYQVQAVTAVGGGNYSSPVTVFLREPSDQSHNEIVIAITVFAIIVSISVIVATILAYKLWLV